MSIHQSSNAISPSPSMPSLGVPEATRSLYVRSTGCLPYVDALVHLRALNTRFLNDSTLAGGPSAGLLAEARDLDPRALDLLSNCPFALFAAPFAVAMKGVAKASSIRAEGPIRDAQEDFASALTFFAWHLALTDVVAFRALLGIGDSERKLLGTASLIELSAIARQLAPHVRVRWAHHPVIWPQLLRFSREGNLPGLQRTRLLARQLLAAELQSELMPGRARSRVSSRSTPAPRTVECGGL